MAEETKEVKGKIIQVIGPVIDIEFEEGHLPKIYNAVRIPRTNTEGVQEDLIAEVEQHLGEDRVRSVA
ncbi:MAG: F0F1 ATP synthase subunit beta, partial [Ignavibacteriaceae bacterium]